MEDLVSYLEFYDSSVDSDSSTEDSDIQCGDEENSLFSFYGALIERMISQYGLSSLIISNELRNMVDSYRRTQHGRNPMYLNFNSLSLCVGYLHRYAICHTVMVRKAFVQLLLSPPDEIRMKLQEKRLDLVFLGSGPGNDLVGF